MNKQSVYSELLKIEEKYDLYKINYEGIYVWERVRMSVFREILRNLEFQGQAHGTDKTRTKEYQSKISNLLKNTIWKNPYRTPDTDILFFGCRRRKQLEDGLWWDIYTDTFLDSLQSEYEYLEAAHFDEHLRPTKTNGVRYLDLINNSAHALRLLSKKLGLDNKSNTTIRSAENEIKHCFDVDVNIHEKIRNSLLFRKYSKSPFKNLLKLVDPNLVVFVTSYRNDNTVVIESCSDLEIPTAELQHGVIHPHHLEFHHPGNRTKRIFPDYLLTWGEFWKESIEYPIDDDRILTVGYPFLAQRIDDYKHIVNKNKILFISQGPIGEQLSKFALEVDRHPNIDYEIVYKLHPGEYDRWRDEYPWLIDADFEIVDSSEPPLYELFAESSVQIGVGSTAVYEGLCFNLETFVYDCPGSSVLKPLVDEGSAELISSADELMLALGTVEVTFNREYYFEPNATKHICKTLQRLASQGSSRNELF